MPASTTFRRNVQWQIVGSFSQALLSGLVLVVMGRVLGPEGFGTYSIVMSYVFVGNLLIEPRMQDVAARQLWDMDPAAPGEHHQRWFMDLLAIEAVVKLVPCASLIALSPWLTRFGGLTDGTGLVIAVAASGYYVTKVGAGLAVGTLRVLGRTDIIAFCVTGELALRLLFLVSFVVTTTLNVLLCVVALSVSGIAFNVVMWLAIRRLMPGAWRGVRAWDPPRMMGSVLRSRRLLLSNVGLSVSDLMNKDLDVTIISSIMSSGEVGIYKMAKNVALLTWRAVDPFYLALMPEVNRLMAMRSFAALRGLLLRCSIGLAALAIGLSIGSYAFFYFLGDAVLGSGFASARALLPWMFVGIVFGAPLVWGHPLSVSLDRADVAFVGSLLGSIVGVGALLILAPTHGMFGAAAAWSLTFMLGFTYTAVVSQLVLRERVRAGP